MSGDSQKGPIGILAVSHCGLAEEMVRVAEMIVGELGACKAICFQAQQGVEEMTAQLRDAIREVDHGRGVLILTDLFGGTPANISLSFLGPNVEVVCGMNLPMLIKLAGCRTDMPLSEAAATVKEYGQRHISLASEILSRNAVSSRE
jgi:PTS system mannose-specific IIA component